MCMVPCMRGSICALYVAFAICGGGYMSYEEEDTCVVASVPCMCVTYHVGAIPCSWRAAALRHSRLCVCVCVCV